MNERNINQEVNNYLDTQEELSEQYLEMYEVQCKILQTSLTIALAQDESIYDTIENNSTVEFFNIPIEDKDINIAIIKAVKEFIDITKFKSNN